MSSLATRRPHRANNKNDHCCIRIYFDVYLECYGTRKGSYRDIERQRERKVRAGNHQREEIGGNRSLDFRGYTRIHLARVEGYRRKGSLGNRDPIPFAVDGPNELKTRTITLSFRTALLHACVVKVILSYTKKGFRGL